MGDGTRLTRLVTLMRRLLADDGCPWDRVQTYESLRPYLIEEAFEVVDAIDSGSRDALREELGDLLFQIVFLSELGAREGRFDLDQVIDGISDKMERRHPHVFGDEPEEDPARWDEIKALEKPGRGVFEGIPRSMPALDRALRVGEKASKFGLDWPDARAVRAKVDEELAELDAAHDHDRETEELGDLLFALTSWARHRSIDPETALRGALTRFEGRFEIVQRSALDAGLRLEDLDAAEIDLRWQNAKKKDQSP